MELGKRYTDTVTHFTGTATAEIRRLNSDEVQVLLEAVDQMGKPIEAWFSNTRVTFE